MGLLQDLLDAIVASPTEEWRYQQGDATQGIIAAGHARLHWNGPLGAGVHLVHKGVLVATATSGDAYDAVKAKYDAVVAAATATAAADLASRRAQALEELRILFNLNS
jgi:hypothetical protein